MWGTYARFRYFFFLDDILYLLREIDATGEKWEGAVGVFVMFVVSMFKLN